MTDRYTVPTAFLVSLPVDVDTITETLAERHTVGGHRLTTLTDLLRDPRFSEYEEDLVRADEDRARSGHGLGRAWAVVDIVWDGEEDDWFDAELQAELDHLPLFCCPGNVRNIHA